MKISPTDLEYLELNIILKIHDEGPSWANNIYKLQRYVPSSP
jgi:hypothetical protein